MRALFITLTIDRAQFLSPELAYQRAQPRVADALSLGRNGAIWFAVLELQTLTGDGWPHWHGIVFVPESERRTDAQLLKAVERRWRCRDVAEEVDTSTGEVRQVKRGFFSLGRVDVQWAASREGVATYCAKYCMKAWAAVAAWMGESNGRPRKYRASDAYYTFLERIHVRDRHRGSRPDPNRHRRPVRPAKPLFHRMALSGLQTDVIVPLSDTSSVATFHVRLPGPPAFWMAKACEEFGAEATITKQGNGRVGTLAMRGHLPFALLGPLVHAHRAEAIRLRDELFNHRLQMLRTAWDAVQHARSLEVE